MKQTHQELQVYRKSCNMYKESVLSVNVILCVSLMKEEEILLPHIEST